jgi:hypothetical protein
VQKAKGVLQIALNLGEVVWVEGLTFENQIFVTGVMTS